MTITVTLPDGWLARDVRLTTHKSSTGWMVVAEDDGGLLLSDVRYCGEPIPPSKTRQEAKGRINSMSAAGVRYWATPRSPGLRSTVMPTSSGGYEVRTVQ